MSVVSEYLSRRFPEVAPLDFYRAVFPSGSLASAPTPGRGPGRYQPGTYNGIMVRVWKEAGAERAERHFILDDLAGVAGILSIDRGLMGQASVTDLFTPISYAGRRPLMASAHELFAIAFDLDYIKVEEQGDGAFAVGLDELLYQMAEYRSAAGRSRLPLPTYVVSSGGGVHVYYLLDRPLRLWPNVIEALSRFRHAMVDMLWNQYVTDEPDHPQYESVFQSFRMPGSVNAKHGEVVRAFSTGAGRWSMEDLNAYVPEAARVPRETYEARHTLEEARALWPEWDPQWRRKALAAPGPRSKWRVKRALFDWWCRRVDDTAESPTEAFDGNRYWCVFVAACLAAKCPEVTYEELERWAYAVRPKLDGLTKRDGNAFTAADVADALKAYGNPLSCKLRRDRIAEKTSLEMPVNKRNGRRQALHLRMARSNLEILGEDAGHALQGRPKGSGTKAEQVRAYAAAHPEASQRQIASALGVSKTTVNKWLKDVG